MKTSVSTLEVKTQLKPTYPCLKKYTYPSDMQVNYAIFTSPTTGMIVHIKKGKCGTSDNVGESLDGWRNFDKWVVCDESEKVTISN